MRENTRPTPWEIIAFLLISATFIAGGSAFAQSKPDRFYLPQEDQPFEGKVDTRIGTLEFSNQYPSKKSVDTQLDAMDFHGATLNPLHPRLRTPHEPAPRIRIS